MTRGVILTSMICVCLNANAQITVENAVDPFDALRFIRSTIPVGTARSMAIGGALTGLGGDISCAASNPAGLAFFKTNEWVLSPGMTLNNNQASYLGSGNSAKQNAFNLGTTGILISTPPSPRSNVRNWSVALTGNQSVNYRNTIVYNGVNTRSSYSEKYLEELISNQVTDPNSAASDFPFGPSLAVNTYLVEPYYDQNNSVSGYYSMATPNTGVKQEQQINSYGSNVAVNLGVAVNLSDKWYLGASMNVDLMYYRRTRTYREMDNTTDPGNFFNYFIAQDSVVRRGFGGIFRFGMMYKPTENIRIGVSVSPPSYLEVKEKFDTRVTTELEGYASPGILYQSTSDMTGQAGDAWYDIDGPANLSAGIAFIFREAKNVKQQRGFISADVELVSYGLTEYSDNYSWSPSLSELNAGIKSSVRNTFNYRVGAELKFNTIMLRGGFGYYTNPYKDPTLDGKRINISGGLGYRNKGMFIDLTYMHQIVKDVVFPYLLKDNYYAPANLSGSVGNIMLTFGFKFHYD